MGFGLTEYLGIRGYDLGFGSVKFVHVLLNMGEEYSKHKVALHFCARLYCSLHTPHCESSAQSTVYCSSVSLFGGLSDVRILWMVVMWSVMRLLVKQ